MPKCPSDKILNPKTDRCVLKSGKIGKELVHFQRKSTKRKPTESKPSEHKPEAKECASDKILNPKTGKCVLRSGKIGQEILKSIQHKPTGDKPIQSKKEIKECASDKVLNPKTGKCVLKSGKIGQEILKNKPGVEQKPVEYKPIEQKPVEQKLIQSKKETKPIDDEYIANAIKNNTWFIITEEGCSYCKQAKSLLEKNNFKYEQLVATQYNYHYIYDIKSKYGIEFLVFPIVFHNGLFIGGLMDLIDKVHEYKKDKLKLTSELYMTKKELAKETKFKGTAWYELVGLLYLHNKYKNACIVISKNISQYKKSLKTVPSKTVNFMNTGIEWKESRSEFTVPDGLWKAIKDCLKSDIDFIVVPFGFQCANGTGHANILIYDKRTQELERFEPNGVVLSNPCYPIGIDDQIKDLFNKNGKGMVKSMYGPIDFCPYLGFQRIQAAEISEKKETDPTGFCAAWSWWYADVRLSNPNKTRHEVIELALNKLKSNPESFTSYIRSYADFLVKAGEKLLKSEDPVKVFKELLKKP